MKVAIVHEWLVNFRGSERVLLELCRMFPNAVVYVSVLDKAGLPAELANRDIRTTFLQRLPFAKKKYQWYLPLMPLAYENLDLTEYDLIISSSHSCAKGIIPSPHAVHVCYCYTPMRYAWTGYQEYRRSLKNPLLRPIMSWMMHRLRKWDVSTTSRVDYFVACSTEIKARIQKFYRRTATVIHPPVTWINDPGPTESSVDQLLKEIDTTPFYLSLGRLVPYKRVDLAVDACMNLGRTLVVAGNGPELDTLKRRAGSTVYFIEEFTDADAARLYASCQALLFPGNEDFGITMVEAQAYGKPVIAYGSGGALDIVVDGVTGVLFMEQTVEHMVRAVEEFERGRFHPEDLQRNAHRFSRESFISTLNQYLSQHTALEESI